jgi:uncharacterized protein YaaR (DUF327 family)
MKNMKNIIDLTLDAITASGKRFSELQKRQCLCFYKEMVSQRRY